jgi:HlyD family secretion protein
MNKITIILLSLSIVYFSGCSGDKHHFDAAGSFEANEIIVSSEANGKINVFHVSEGDQVQKGDTIARIETDYLKLQRDQVESKLHAIRQKTADADPAVQVLKQQLAAANAKIDAAQTQLEVIQKEEQRIQNLFKAEAATAQQMDEISGKVSVLKKEMIAAQKQADVLTTQIQSSKRTVSIQNRAILSELEPVEMQLKILDDQINKATILSPADGTVLNQFAEAGELTGMGKPLVKIADLSTMEFKAYISGNQLPNVQFGQDVLVYIDGDNDNFRSYPGRISWIADKAEFTPKSIQTKDERANLVYPIKVMVENDGAIKIGMYGELSLNAQKAENE